MRRAGSCGSGSAWPWLPASLLPLGYGLLGDMGPFWVPLIQAFAAGAILTMLVDTMIPEAFEGGGSLTGLRDRRRASPGLLP